MSELLDRFYAQVRESERAWTADEIAAQVLRMKPGPATAGLVGAVLRADGRFHERDDGLWDVHSSAGPAILSEPLRVVWFEAGEGESLRVHLTRWAPHASASVRIELDGADPSRWFGRAEELFAERWATAQPSLCQRWLRRMDRLWALGEPAQVPVDVSAWARLALLDEGVALESLDAESQLDRLALRWGGSGLAEDGAGRLRLLETFLDHLAESHGHWTDEDLDRARESRLDNRPIDWSALGFTPDALAAVPGAPGVYRLLGEGDVVLYVGKALQLSRRLQEHFRPLPRETTKREEMIREVRGFAYEELPSELEALIREHRAIVERRPRWNVQVDVRPPRHLPEDWAWPLLYVAPGAGPERTVVLLTSADRGVLLRERGESADLPRLVEALVEALEEDRAETAIDRPSMFVLRPPEAWLALRYYARHRDRIDRIDPLASLAPPELAERVRSLVAAERESHAREVRG